MGVLVLYCSSEAKHFSKFAVKDEGDESLAAACVSIVSLVYYRSILGMK